MIRAFQIDPRITHATVVQRRRPLLHLRNLLGQAGGVHQERRRASPHEPRFRFGRGATVAPAPHVLVGDIPERGFERRGLPRGRHRAPVARRVAERAGLHAARAPRLACSSAPVHVFVTRVTRRLASRHRGGAHLEERKDGKTSENVAVPKTSPWLTDVRAASRHVAGGCASGVGSGRLGEIIGGGKLTTERKSERFFQRNFFRRSGRGRSLSFRETGSARDSAFFPPSKKTSEGQRVRHVPDCPLARRGAGGGRVVPAES